MLTKTVDIRLHIDIAIKKKLDHKKYQEIQGADGTKLVANEEKVDELFRTIGIIKRTKITGPLA